MSAFHQIQPDFLFHFFHFYPSLSPFSTFPFLSILNSPPRPRTCPYVRGAFSSFHDCNTTALPTGVIWSSEYSWFYVRVRVRVVRSRIIIHRTFEIRSSPPLSFCSLFYTDDLTLFPYYIVEPLYLFLLQSSPPPSFTPRLFTFFWIYTCNFYFSSGKTFKKIF